MSDTLRTAAQQALEALLTVRINSSVSVHQLALISPAIDALRAALAEPDVPEVCFGNMSDTLPPLPESDYLLALPDQPYDPGYVTMESGYTADQMRSYAASALAAAVAEPVALETRADGKMVRVDRWEWGIRRIVAILWGNRHEFEIDDVVDAVRALAPGQFADDESLVRAVETGYGAAPAAPPQREREPLTEAQAERLYQNIKPSQQQDARSCAAFKRLVRVVEGAHGIAPASAPREQA